MRALLHRLIADRRGIAAAIVAVTLPAMLIGVAVAVEASLIEVRQSQLQSVADASANAARETYDSFKPTGQSAAVTEAVRIAGLNDATSAVDPGNVVEGWWDITKTATDPTTGTVDKFGPCVPGQTGGLFCNAIRVTATDTHGLALGALLGRSSIPLARKSTGYKCSNTDYPLTLVPDDKPSPPLPALYMSWATPGHDANTSYYYLQPDGSHNPIYKFWSPTDGEDVSYVLTFYIPATPSHGPLKYQLQVDTYCRGTYLVSPAEFDSRNFVDDAGNPVTITGTVLRGNTNNSFDTYPDQRPYPFQAAPTPYYTANEVPTPEYNLTKVHTTPYPSSSGIHFWASEGNPTPDRRTTMVR